MGNCTDNTLPLPKPDLATHSILRRIGFGTGAVFTGQVITMLGQLLLVPLFLWAWGDGRYGEWLSLCAMVGYLTMINLGMGTYVVNRLNQVYTVGKLDEYNQILNSALKVFLVIAGAGCLVATALYLLLPFETWFNFSYTAHITMTLVGILLSLQILGGIPLGLITGTYRTFGEFHRCQIISNVERFLFFVVTAVVLAVEGRLLAVATVQLLPMVVIAIYVLKDLGSRHPEIEVGITKASLPLVMTFLGPSLFFLLIQLSVGLTLQGSTLLVAAVVSPSAVAVFVTLRTLANLVRQIVGSINSVLWPELTSLEALKDYARLHQAHTLLVKVSLGMCGCAAVFLHFEAQDIVAWWTGGRIVFDQILMDLFLAYLVFQTPWLASSLFPAAVNRQKELALAYIVSAVLGLLCGYLFSAQSIGIGLGSKGVILGILLGEVIIAGWYVPSFTCRMVGESIKRYWLSLIFPGTTVLVMEGIAAWFVQGLSSSPQIRLLLVFATVLVVGIAGNYLFNTNRHEKMQLHCILRKATEFF